MAVNASNLLPSETLTLGASTVHTSGRLALNYDTLAIHVVTTGTASGAWSLECSSDNASWSAVTLTTSPPAAAGSPQDFWIVYDWLEFPYVRLTFAGTGGAGSATVTTTLKG